MDKNYNSLNLDKFPISGGISPDISFEDNHLNNNENIKMMRLIIMK